MAAIMLAGCNKVATHMQVATPNIVGEKEENSKNEKIEQLGQSNSQSNNVKTYEDETHKKVEYGKLSFDVDSYHIVSYMQSGNSATFKCEIDKGEVRLKTHMTITIRKVGKQDFLDTESIISYLSNMSPNYEKIEIYNNVKDDYEITSLYIVKEDKLTKYVVCYRDDCYLIEYDDSRMLDDCTYKYSMYEGHYTVNKQKTKYTTAYITFSFNDGEFEKAKYDIIQGKDETTYSAKLSFDEKNQYNFTLKNEKGENLLALYTNALYFNSVIKIRDVNLDGYADIQFLEEEDTVNNSYALYIWDDSTKNFVKVKCDELLSDYKVYDGYLLNWIKIDVQSGSIQKLVWDKNALIKESEEHYQVDE